MNKVSETTIFTILATVSVGIFVISSFFISFSLPLYILCIGIASIFILKKPEVGLYSNIILSIIFGFSHTLLPLVWNDVTYKIYPIDVLTIITLTSFLLYKLRNSEIKLKTGGRLGILILVFMAFCLFSMLYGILQGGSGSLAFSTFKNYAVYGIFFFMVINIIDNKQRLKELFNVFLVSGILLLFFVFLGLVQGSGLWIEFTPLSTEGTRLLAPNHAFYLCIAIIFSINFLAFKKNIFGKLTTLIILAQTIGVAGSLTRHLWLALGVTLALSFLLLPKDYKKNLLKLFAYQGLLLIVVIIIYALFSFIFLGEVEIFGLNYINDAITRFQSLFFYTSDQDTSIYFRLLAWDKAFKLLQASPFIGIGFGQKLSFDLLGWPMVIEVRELHNNFIGMILQMGALGFFSFIAFNIFLLRETYVLFRKISKKLYPYLLGSFVCYVLFIFSANFGTYFDTNVLVISYWIFIGIIFVIRELNSAKNKIEV